MHALSRRVFLFVRWSRELLVVKYTKPALSLDDQADLLLKRGMMGDRAKMIRRLSAVSYYRLSGYWFHRKRADDSFEPVTRFDVESETFVRTMDASGTATSATSQRFRTPGTTLIGTLPLPFPTTVSSRLSRSARIASRASRRAVTGKRAFETSSVSIRRSPPRTWDFRRNGSRVPCGKEQPMQFRKSAFHGSPRLKEQFAEGARLEKEIRRNLRGLGYGD